MRNPQTCTDLHAQALILFHRPRNESHSPLPSGPPLTHMKVHFPGTQCASRSIRAASTLAVVSEGLLNEVLWGGSSFETSFPASLNCVEVVASRKIDISVRVPDVLLMLVKQMQSAAYINIPQQIQWRVRFWFVGVDPEAASSNLIGTSPACCMNVSIVPRQRCAN